MNGFLPFFRRPQCLAFLRRGLELSRNTMTVRLAQGVGMNVIPSEAEATLDVRALPGEDIERFYAQMTEIIGDPAVKVVPIPPARPPGGPDRGAWSGARSRSVRGRPVGPTRRCRPPRGGRTGRCSSRASVPPPVAMNLRAPPYGASGRLTRAMYRRIGRAI